MVSLISPSFCVISERSIANTKTKNIKRIRSCKGKLSQVDKKNANSLNNRNVQVLLSILLMIEKDRVKRIGLENSLLKTKKKPNFKGCKEKNFFCISFSNFVKKSVK